MEMNIKKAYQTATKRNKRRQKSLYERKALLLILSLLYIILGTIDRIPFFVFQALFLLEGFAFFHDSINSSLKKSTIAMGVLCIAWTVVISLQTSLTTGYAVSVSNQVVVCNLIYVAILGIVIYQTNVKKNLYANKALKNACVIICSISIVVILSLLFLMYMMQLTEVLNLEITPLLAGILKLGQKSLPLAVKFPIAEWLLHGSIICSILLQSNSRYKKSRYQGE